jgi:3-hexulose-6-phosphate synthase
LDGGDTGALLQLALDLYDLDEALGVAEACAESVDYLEIGTPLLWSTGVHAIEAVRARFPSLPLVADFKIMDRGAEVTRYAAEAGADGVIVQAVAPAATIDAVCVASAAADIMVMVDGLGVPDLEGLHMVTTGRDVSHVIVHRGKDEQAEGMPFGAVSALRGSERHVDPILAVAGGLTRDNIGRVLDVPAVRLLVVGEAIYADPDPARAAAHLRDLCTSTDRSV